MADSKIGFTETFFTDRIGSGIKEPACVLVRTKVLKALDRLVGRYRIDPVQIGAGGFINVTRNGDTINASAPENGRDWPLEAESETDFAIVGLGTPVSFHLDAGKVTGLTYHYNGQEIAATRLR